MGFTASDIEMSHRYFEQKLKVTLGPSELHHMMEDPKQKDAFMVIDVRSAGGYRKEHIPGSVNIPEEELERRLDEIPKDKEIIVYCWTIVCHLAAHAGLTLAKNGYFARELEGGIAMWKDYELPVASGLAGAGARRQ